MLTITPAQVHSRAPLAPDPVMPRFVAVAVAQSPRARAVAVTQHGRGLPAPQTQTAVFSYDDDVENVRTHVVAAVLDAYAHAQARDETLYVCVPEGTMSQALATMEQRVPGLRHVYAREAGSTMAAVLATAEQKARTTLEAAGPTVDLPTVRVATDASMQQHRQGAGLGVLTDQGQAVMGLSSAARTTSHGELAALALALRSVERDKLLLVCDNRWAVSVMRRLLRATDPHDRSGLTLAAALAPLDAIAHGTALDIVESRHRRQIDVAWTKGHADDQLNLGADRLAVLARRSVRGGCDPETTSSVAERIIADHVTQSAGAPTISPRLRSRLGAGSRSAWARVA